MTDLDAASKEGHQDPKPAAQAGFFGDAERPVFAWLHRPVSTTATTATTALVIVPPFGYEAICSRRGLRHLADDAASAGLLAVRVDLDGTGNSVGGDLDPDRLGAWTRSIDSACNLARANGADRIVLIGVRFGALLATLAAARRQDVCALVTIAAVTSGKHYLRECRMLQSSLALRSDPSACTETFGQEIVGFVLSEESSSAIAAINLAETKVRPAPIVFVIERNDLPGNADWISHLEGLGCNVYSESLPGYADMVLDPHHAQVPQAMIDAALALVVGLPADASAADCRQIPALESSARIRHGDVEITEQVVVLDDCMTAIASIPDKPTGRTVILLNAGAIGLIGPNRLYVTLARRLACSGDRVLRVDLSGIADSPPRSGSIENTVYSEHAVADIAKAVEWAHQTGASEICVAGLCSGGYHALKAALAELPINRIVVINPLTFHYAPGMPLDYSASRVTEDVNRYAASARTRDSWMKLLRGEVDLHHLVRVLAARSRMYISSKFRNILRRLPIPLRNDLGCELTSLAKRDVALRFVFSASDPGYAMLREQAGSVVDHLLESGQMRITLIDGSDHTFTARWSHEPLLHAVEKALHS